MAVKLRLGQRLMFSPTSFLFPWAPLTLEKCQFLDCMRTIDELTGSQNRCAEADFGYRAVQIERLGHPFSASIPRYATGKDQVPEKVKETRLAFRENGTCGAGL